MERTKIQVKSLLLPIYLIFALNVLQGCKSSGEKEQKRPNILFVIADDWSWPHASLAGDKVVKTPGFDRVAKEGVFYTNAYVSVSSCSPSRAAILTGQDFWRLEDGSILWGTLPSKFPMYTDLLEDSGYHVGYTGKGWGPGDITAGGRTRNPAGDKYQDFNQFLETRQDGEPFCFWFGSRQPHRHYEWKSGVENGLNPNDVEVPPIFPDSEEVRLDLCDYYHNVEILDNQIRELIKTLEARNELENTMIVVTSDNGLPFPRGKANSYDLGTRVPLAIRWPGVVKPGRNVDDFVSLVDLAPTFLEAAGVAIPDVMTGKSLMNNLRSEKSDLVEPSRDKVFTGKERHAFLGYPTRAIRTHDFLYIKNYKPERNGGGHPEGDNPEGLAPEQSRSGYGRPFSSIDGSPTKAYMMNHRSEPEVKKLFELAFLQRPAEELYDLKNDPYQMNNVAEDPSYAHVKTGLREALNFRLNETEDPRILGNGDIFDTYKKYSRGNMTILK